MTKLKKKILVSHWTWQARECKRQFDVRRFRLEGALEDLRRRTLENERLEAQATTMRGEGEALRELADARGLESTGLREKLARYSVPSAVPVVLEGFLRRFLHAVSLRSKTTARASGFADSRSTCVHLQRRALRTRFSTYRHNGEFAPVSSRGRHLGNDLSCLELLSRLVRLVQEAKGMSSENVNIRKQLSSEQERWRAAERSRAKHDERRRIEMERKSDDVHALRYRYACIYGVTDWTYLSAYAPIQCYPLRPNADQVRGCDDLDVHIKCESSFLFLSRKGLELISIIGRLQFALKAAPTI